VKRIERVRLYATPRQLERLQFMLDVTRELYNALLEQRREAYKRRGVRVSAKQQYAEITALRKADARLRAVYRECQDAVLHRLDLAFAAFFRRLARGRTPGYPRFKPRSRWAQLEFPHGDRALKFNAVQTKVFVPGVGAVRLRKGRAVPALGRAWLVCKNERWYACFECEREAQPAPRPEETLGIDRGVHVLAACSDSRLVRNPRVLEKARLQIERLQRVVARRKRGGRNRRKAVRRLARLHEHVANRRRDAMHKAARKIINAAPSSIVLEKLNVCAMTRSARGTVEQPGRNVAAKAALNRAMLDASFGLLQQLIVSKAEEAGITVVAVDARYSSQECWRCHHVAAESRVRRRFRCVACGFTVHADVNAALVLTRRAESRPAGRGGASAHLDDLRRLPDAGGAGYVTRRSVRHSKRRNYGPNHF
jgi:putative transposase